MKPKIIFFGTPIFAVGILNEIRKRDFIIEAVVTSPDKKAGRGRKLTGSEVKKYCVSKNIKLYQPQDLNNSTFISNLKSHNADIFVVVAFRIIPKIVWSIPKKGTFNLHASLLPNYRGAAPINWVIINQEKITGLTTFFIDKKIDTGKILLKQKYKINKTETFDSLHYNLMEIGKKLVIKTINLIFIKKINPQIQKISGKNLKLAPKLNKMNTKINWEDSLEKIVSFINGLNSYPGAWSEIIENKKIDTFKIYECEPEYNIHNISENKILVINKQIKISHKEGFLIIKSLKLANKKRLSNTELLNGYTFKTGVFVS